MMKRRRSRGQTYTESLLVDYLKKKERKMRLMYDVGNTKWPVVIIHGDPRIVNLWTTLRDIEVLFDLGMEVSG